jgi:hypothetical protein
MRETGLVLLGTIRSDGWPRISPCEAYVVDGDLMLGMMWQSKKALDLQRDARITIATVQSEREPVHGDLKLYGAAVDVPEAARRLAYSDALHAAISWRPSEPYHLFAAGIERAGFISFGESARLLRWSPETGTEVLRHPDVASSSS